jgi:hypothetical protein
MNRPLAVKRFFLCSLAAAAFVAFTSQSLPPVVASHFGGDGYTNGFMTRSFYTWFMLAFVIVLPLILVHLPGTTFRRPGARINLPHGDYRLHPERREESIAFLVRHAVRLGIALIPRSIWLACLGWEATRPQDRALPRALPTAREYAARHV